MQEQYTRPQTRPLVRCMVLGAVVSAGACMGRSPRGASAAHDATILSADGRIAPAATGTRETSKTPGPPAAGLAGLVPAPGPGPAARIVPAGTTLALVSNARVCTNTYHPGDTFTGTVTDTVTTSGGAVVPAGSLADFEVTGVTSAPDASHARRISVALDSLAIDGVRYPASARITSIVTRKVRSTSPSEPDVAAIGGGSEPADMLGVILGQGDRSTVIGAAEATRRAAAEKLATDFCVPRNGRITLTLTSGERLQ